MKDTSLLSAMCISGQRLTLVLTGGALVAAVWMSVNRAREAPHRPAVVSPAAPRVAWQRCAECHSDITDEFHLASHARTLHRADDDEVLGRFAGQSFHRTEPDVSYDYRLQDGRLVLSTPAYARDLPIEWIFGSGTHAQTPLITWTDDHGNSTGIEHIVSWYPGDEALGLTLGTEESDAASGIHALGRHWGPAETINCFGCHSTFVPTDGRQILFDQIQAGVTCARCHWNVATHVQEMNDELPATIERFAEMAPRESVDRCGECHRRADEMGGPVTADNETIVRFAPVGLVQSPCFKRQQEVILESGRPARLDCTTCHDPHRPAEQDWRLYVQSCLNCHDAGSQRAADCSIADRQDNCLTCHMPKVPMNPQLAFTDHWIRVRDNQPGGMHRD